MRPIPTSFPGGISPQTYLDHLANLKALYDQHQASQQSSPGSPPGSTANSSPLTPATSGASTTTASIGPPPPHLPHGQPGLPPGLPPGFPPGLAFPRPGLPGSPAGLPPMLFGPGGPPNMSPQIPREYPLYPWFISRRFPGGKFIFLDSLVVKVGKSQKKNQLILV